MALQDWLRSHNSKKKASNLGLGSRPTIRQVERSAPEHLSGQRDVKTAQGRSVGGSNPYTRAATRGAAYNALMDVINHRSYGPASAARYNQLAAYLSGGSAPQYSPPASVHASGVSSSLGNPQWGQVGATVPQEEYNPFTGQWGPSTQDTGEGSGTVWGEGAGQAVLDAWTGDVLADAIRGIVEGFGNNIEEQESAAARYEQNRAAQLAALARLTA